MYNNIISQEYVALRNRYIPDNLKVIFILESPPLGHGYFYNPEGRVSEVLFRSFMKVIDFVPTTKDEGLQKLAEKGYLLVNPIYIPVNKLPDREADAIILNNYPNFVEDLNALIKRNKATPIILVKANILRLLEQPMIRDGYNVINRGLLIPFPLHYHLNNFLERLRSILPE